jgi:dihydrofolate synthase/folylpolyglutamate synthase
MDPLAYLFGLEVLGIKFGLDNIRALAASLDNPHTAYASVHVAGTNGKGSTSAMIERALRASGRRTGRYTSPHLTRLEERFAIDGVPAPEAEIREIAGLVRTHVDRLMASGVLSTHPTFFEVTTAMAFELFRRRRVEIGVFEVGLGGRHDATNILAPSACAITSIDLDHELLLGRTLAAIAREKAGIVKAGVPVVVGRLAPEAETAIAEVAAGVGAPFIRAHEDVGVRVQLDQDGVSLIDLATSRRDYGRVRLALRGRHQVDNAIVAVRVLEALDEAGWQLEPEHVRAGLEQAHWPGRLDLRRWSDGRQALFDAAHNPAGAAALADYLQQFSPEGLPLVFAAMADKDWEGMLRVLRPYVSRLVVTRPATRRAADPGLIARGARAIGIGSVSVVEPARAALEEAWRAAPLVLVAGSLFLVGELLARDARG